MAGRTLPSTPAYSYAYSTVVAPAPTPVSSPLPIHSEPTASTSTLETETTTTPPTPKKSSAPTGNEPEPRLLSYFVRRTAGGELPVYVDVLHGGSKRLTLIRKVDGNLEALRQDLSQYLVGVPNYIKPHARQVVVKGDYVRQTKEWLAAMGF
ncbi:BZ3500_MvSof-1268-A1-R1_Chr8-1g09980 [Microbotryum saponariae]|uniref:Large ribosomal subunit protein mL49 n=1 Tax=Microbotryum saponariae TaxID=289078 RepID=A0A2X0MU33_9BASI|nr:BZ3500_MvSof-1268-A1-R1_Chr8-1g09980 [Microbotryum saponariae]SDA08266.1 BZ3501_MvSof-1269-A2-R1_Chr8-1g09703 [Microbotryum saponariae]